jgi:hypothetical protein
MASPEHTPPPPERRRHGPWSWLRRRFMRAHARGGDSDDPARINLDPDIVMAALFAMLLLLGGLVGLTLYQQGRISDQQQAINDAQRHIGQNQERLGHQQRMLTYLEHRDRIGSYQTAYRFCTRIDIDRAAVHDLWSYELPTLSQAKIRPRVSRFLRSYTQRLEDRGGLPILDCEPNVRGGAARYQSPREQRRFVRRWRRYQLDAAELGICKIRIGVATNPRQCIN